MKTESTTTGDLAPEVNNTVSPVDTFTYVNGAPLRVFGTIAEPLFLAKESCDAIGLTDQASAMKRVPDWAKGVGVRSLPLGGRGGVQIMATLTEAGLYYLLMRSDKPEAEAFQRWVCCEVLPSIRRTGFYAATGGEPVQARRVRELQWELEAQRHLLAAEEARRRIILLRGGVPALSPVGDMQTITDYCAIHQPKVRGHRLLELAIIVKAYAKRTGATETRVFPTGNPRYSRPAWSPATIAAALKEAA